MEVQGHYTWVSPGSATSALADAVQDHLSEHVKPTAPLCILAELSHALRDPIEKFGAINAVTKTRGMNDDDKILQCQHQNSWKHPHLDFAMRWSARLAIITVNNVDTVCPRSYILLLQNKLSDIVSVLLYAQTASGASLEPEAYDITYRFLQCLISMATKYGTAYFTIAKTLEAFVAAQTLSDSDTWKNDAFFNALDDACYEDTKFRYRDSRLHTIFCSASVSLQHELGCLGKLTGHPYVDMDEGTATLRDTARMPLPINQQAVQETVRFAKKEFIKSYIHRHQKWPPIEWACSVENVPGGILYAQVTNSDPDSAKVRERKGEVLLTHYDYVELQPILEFDFINNIIPELKDKTVSVLRSKVIEWHLSQPPIGDAPRWQETRLLLVYLLAPDLIMNHETYIKKYTAAEHLSLLHNYLVIRIVPKEKELKVAYRGFGCKTYEDRMRGVVQEKNVMRYLDMYSDEQAMTLSELDLTKKLCSFRYITNAYPDHAALYVCVDASKWNNRFRDDLVRPVTSATLDKLFNYPIFSKTHEAFQNTLFYVPDEEGVSHWEGQEGGIEGLNQDTWVVCYIAMIKATLHDENLKCHFLCKGDDLRIVFLIPKNLLRDPLLTDAENRERTSLEEIRERVVTKISERSAEMGHKIKVDDSYGSETYFSFSKAASIKNVELPQTYRKIAKTSGNDNSLLPLTDNIIGSCYSNAHSAARVTVDPVACYYVGLVWAYYHLISHDAYNNLTDDQLTALLLVPSVLGGFPVIYLHNIFVRAESDLLAPALGLFHHCQTHFPRIYKWVRGFLRVQQSPHVDYFVGLLMDPYSLAFDKPPLPAALLRKAVLPAIEKRVKAKDVIELLRAGSPKYSKPLIEALRECKPYNPRILSATYSSGPAGLVTEFTRKFETARSICELLITVNSITKTNSILRGVIRADLRMQQWRALRISGTRIGNRDLEEHLSPCPAFSANEIRELLWGNKIEGITMPPMQHQVRLVDPNTVPVTLWNLRNHFLYRVEEATTSVAPHSFSFTAGKKYPFVGYITRSGTTNPILSFTEKDPTLSKIKNLAELMEWTNTASHPPDVQVPEGTDIRRSNYPDLLKKIITLYLPVDVEDILPFAGTRQSGTIAHHVRSPKYKESIVPNCLSNPYTRIVGESNTHLGFREAGAHLYVNFLHIMCHNVMNITCINLYLRSRSATEYWGVTTECKFCNREIIETPLVIPAPLIREVDYHPLSMTQLSDVAQRILKQSLEAAPPELRNLPTGRDHVTVRHACYAVVQELNNQSAGQQHRLQDRFTQHAMGHEGKTILQDIASKTSRRTIGISEVRCIPASLLLDSVSYVICRTLLERFPRVAEEHLPSLLMTLPQSELPWSGLVQALHKCLRLNETLSRFAKALHQPLPRCYDSPTAASALLALYSYQYASQSQTGPTIIRLVRYTDAEFANTLVGVIPYMRRHLVLRVIAPAIDAALSLGRTDVADHIRVRMRLCIYILNLATPEKETVLSELAQVTTQFSGEVPLLLCCEWDPGFFEGLWEEGASEDWSPESKWFLRKHKRWPWEEAIPDPEEDISDDWAALDHELTHYTADVCITDDGSIKQIVRSLPQRAPINTDPRFREPGSSMIIRLRESSYASVLERTSQVLELENLRDTFRPNPDIGLYCIDQGLHPYMCHRVFSAGNSSASRLIELLQIVYDIDGAYPSWNNVRVFCLADGLGGFTATLASICTNSVIGFSTLAVNAEHAGEAPAALSQSESRGNIIDSSLSLTGAGDLRGEFSVAGMRTTLREDPKWVGQKISLITCDMDHPWEKATPQERDDYLTALKNVCRIYLENRTEDTVLICKVFIYDLRALDMMTALLWPACRVYRVEVPASSSRYIPEVYVIAALATELKHSDTVVLSSSCRLAGTSKQIITRCRERIVKVLRSRDSQAREGVCLFGNVPEPRLAYFQYAISHTFDTLLMEELHINRSHLSARERGTPLRDMPTDNFRIFVTQLSSTKRTLLDELVGLTNTFSRLHERVDLNTEAHVLAVMKKVVTIDGLIYVLGKMLTAIDCHGYNNILPPEEVWDVYQESIAHLRHHAERLKGWSPVTEAHRKWDLNRQRPKGNPFRCFLRGIRIGLTHSSSFRTMDDDDDY